MNNTILLLLFAVIWIWAPHLKFSTHSEWVKPLRTRTRTWRPAEVPTPSRPAEGPKRMRKQISGGPRQRHI